MEKVQGGSYKQSHQIYEQAGIKYDDSLSVFEGDEEEIKNLENTFNYFDLHLGLLNIDESTIGVNPHNKIKATNSLISFVTVDFYNHETQHSNFLEGNSKKFDNNYSFKV